MQLEFHHGLLATTINAELAEPTEKTGSVRHVLRFLRWLWCRVAASVSRRRSWQVA